MKTQRECLMKLTLDELNDLGFRLLTSPPKNHRSRSAWCDAILPAMEQGKALIFCLAQEEWDILGRYAPAHMDADEWTVSFAAAKCESLLGDALTELRLLGLAWRDVHCWHVLPEAATLARMAQEDRAALSCVEHCAQVALGYLMLYGMMTASDLLDLLKKEGVTDAFLDQVLMDLFRKRYGLSFMWVHKGQLWFVSPDVTSPEVLYEQVTSDIALSKPYASYRADEALYAWQQGLPGRVDAYDEILQFYASIDVDAEEAMDCLRDAIPLAQNGFVDDALSALSQPLTRFPTPKELKTLNLLIARVPMWHLKGRCLEDLLPTTVRFSDRVRQDDPCPCGSGRRYKHCCGRLQ